MQSLDDLVSLAVDGPRHAEAVASYLRARSDWLEVVAGIDSVVVQVDVAQVGADAAQRRLEELLDAGLPALPAEDTLLEIPIVYGGESGPDLEPLCDKLGMTEEEFVALHTGAEYSVDMLGFTPGFAFISGLDERLQVARREEPRQHVAAGSVGIADGRTGIYSLASPGGWTIIGRTPMALFDPHADDPFLIRAGMRIRFTAVAPDNFET